MKISERTNPDEISKYFTTENGYHCARWGRPIAPVFFGIADETLPVMKGALEAICRLCDHPMSETDPELGSNLMVFFCREWSEVLGVPDLDHLLSDLPQLVERLDAEGVHRLHRFRFDKDGSIQLCIAIICMSGDALDVPAETIALDLAARIMLTWNARAFSDQPMLISSNEGAVLRPVIAAILSAAYDKTMPITSDDASHALRMAARIPQLN